MKKAMTRLVILVSWLAMAITQTVWSQPTTQLPITTAQIAAETPVGLACLNYNPLAGACFWLICNPFSGKCYITTSPKVSHRNPDVTVSTYPHTLLTPWTELRVLFQPLGELVRSIFPYFIDGGNDTNGKRQNEHVATEFMEVDVIGNPGLALMSAFTVPGMLCPSEATPMFVYYSSLIDAINWRFASLEMLYPASLIPGLREIGDFPLNTWGAVYPRTGYTTQNEHPKAAAIVAQRAGDIVTRSLQPHIYWEINNDCSRGSVKCWSPEGLEENDTSSGVWQLIKPYPSPTCEAFGENDTLSILPWSTLKQDMYGDIMWNLWRPYSCCLRLGKFLYATSF